MHAQLPIAVLIGLAAAIEDIFHRRISNWIPLTAFAAGLCALAFERGWHGILSALAGACGGFIVFFVFYWLGGMGGGDVKLMAGLGAVVGMERLMAATLWTAVCGGLLAAVCVAVSMLRKAWAAHPGAGPIQSIPYAPAIALGSWLALLSKV
jgi:prepilin peptidase CpaA